MQFPVRSLAGRQRAVEILRQGFRLGAFPSGPVQAGGQRAGQRASQRVVEFVAVGHYRFPF